MHEEWYRKLVDLKRQQRHELEQWKQSRKLDREERWRQLARDGEANLVRDEQQTKQLQQWVSTWKKQRHNVYRQLEMWKVSCPLASFGGRFDRPTSSPASSRKKRSANSWKPRRMRPKTATTKALRTIRNV